MWMTKYFVDAQLEENWLNDMARQGKNFTKNRAVFYTFEDCAPGEYIYKIELMGNLSHEKSKEYYAFLQENGIEVACRYLRWTYLRKKNDGKPFELYTDKASLLSYYKRLRSFYRPMGLLNLGAETTLFILWSYAAIFNRQLQPNILITIANFPIAYMCLSADARVKAQQQKIEKEATISE